MTLRQLGTSFPILRRFPAPGRLLAVAVLLLWAGAAGSAAAQENAARILLDYTPMTQPVSTFVRLRETGDASIVRYNRYQLVVTRIDPGLLSADRAGELLKSTGNPPLNLKTAVARAHR